MKLNVIFAFKTINSIKLRGVNFYIIDFNFSENQGVKISLNMLNYRPRPNVCDSLLKFKIGSKDELVRKGAFSSEQSMIKFSVFANDNTILIFPKASKP